MTNDLAVGGLRTADRSDPEKPVANHDDKGESPKERPGDVVGLWPLCGEVLAEKDKQRPDCDVDLEFEIA